MALGMIWLTRCCTGGNGSSKGGWGGVGAAAAGMHMDACSVFQAHSRDAHLRGSLIWNVVVSFIAFCSRSHISVHMALLATGLNALPTCAMVTLRCAPVKTDSQLRLHNQLETHHYI